MAFLLPDIGLTLLRPLTAYILVTLHRPRRGATVSRPVTAHRTTTPVGKDADQGDDQQDECKHRTRYARPEFGVAADQTDDGPYCRHECSRAEQDDENDRKGHRFLSFASRLVGSYCSPAVHTRSIS